MGTGESMETVAVQGGQLVYQDYGEGVPLVMLHSEYLSHGVWRGQVNPFSHKFRMITCDLRGHGDSVLASEPCTPLLMAQDVIALLDALRLDRAMIIGHGLGGIVGQEIAIQYPERVDALVIADAPYCARATLYDRLNARVSRAAQNWVGVEYVMKRLHATSSTAFRDYVNREIARHRDNPQNFAHVQHLLDHFDNRDRLSQIQCLSLILVGEHSQSMHSHARTMNEAIQGSFYGVVLGAGHMLHWDNPALFNGIVGEFLDGAAALNA